MTEREPTESFSKKEGPLTTTTTTTPMSQLPPFSEGGPVFSSETTSSITHMTTPRLPPDVHVAARDELGHPVLVLGERMQGRDTLHSPSSKQSGTGPVAIPRLVLSNIPTLLTGASAHSMHLRPSPTNAAPRFAPAASPVSRISIARLPSLVTGSPATTPTTKASTNSPISALVSPRCQGPTEASMVQSRPHSPGKPFESTVDSFSLMKGSNLLEGFTFSASSNPNHTQISPFIESELRKETAQLPPLEWKRELPPLEWKRELPPLEWKREMHVSHSPIRSAYPLAGFRHSPKFIPLAPEINSSYTGDPSFSEEPRYFLPRNVIETTPTSSSPTERLLAIHHFTPSTNDTQGIPPIGSSNYSFASHLLFSPSDARGWGASPRSTVAPQPQTHVHSHMPYAPVSPRFTPVSPRFTPVSPRFTPVSPRFTPVSPRFTPVSPRFTPVSPRFTPVSSRFTSLSPRFTPVSPPNYNLRSPIVQPSGRFPGDAIETHIPPYMSAPAYHSWLPDKENWIFGREVDWERRRETYRVDERGEEIDQSVGLKEENDEKIGVRRKLMIVVRWNPHPNIRLAPNEVVICRLGLVGCDLSNEADRAKKAQSSCLKCETEKMNTEFELMLLDNKQTPLPRASRMLHYDGERRLRFEVIQVSQTSSDFVGSATLELGAVQLEGSVKSRLPLKSPTNGSDMRHFLEVEAHISECL